MDQIYNELKYLQEKGIDIMKIYNVDHVKKSFCLNVSAVIPTYNSANYIEKTINSLLNQTYQFLEIIIVDDCSNDDTYSVCMEIAASASGLISVHRLLNNSGPSTARNLGMQLAKGEWVLFMDSDDIAEPQLLELEWKRLKQLEKENRGNWVLVHSAYKQFGESDEKNYGIQRWKQVEPDEIFGYEIVRNYISTSGVLLKKETALSVGGFDTNIKYSEDWDLWLRLSQLGGFGYVDKPLVKVRRHAGNTSRKIEDMLEGERRVLERYSVDIINEAIHRRHLPWEVNRADFVSVLYRLGRWEEGFKFINEVIGIKTDYPTAYFLLGIYYLHHKRWDNAGTAFEKVIKLDEGHGAALNNLGGIMAVLGRKDKAEELFEKAIALLPGYIDATHNLQRLKKAKKMEISEVKFTWRELRSVLTYYVE